MKIIVHELMSDGLQQELTPERNMIVEAIRPRLYRHNFATGSLKMQVIDGSNAVVAESETIQIADIGSAAFFHGHVRFQLNAGLKKGQPYSFKLIGFNGYGFSETAYIGWCNGYDLGKYEASYSPASTLTYPLDIEIWERTSK